MLCKPVAAMQFFVDLESRTVSWSLYIQVVCALTMSRCRCLHPRVPRFSCREQSTRTRPHGRGSTKHDHCWPQHSGTITRNLSRYCSRSWRHLAGSRVDWRYLGSTEGQERRQAMSRYLRHCRGRKGRYWFSLPWSAYSDLGDDWEKYRCCKAARWKSKLQLFSSFLFID